MNKWVFQQNGLTRTSLSATVTRVSNFVEENVCVVFFPHRRGSPSRCIQSRIVKQSHALSMFKALNKGFK